MILRLLLSFIYFVLIVNISFADQTGMESLTPKESINGKWGYIDDKGKYKIRPQFEQAMPFKDGIAMVAVMKKFGFINLSGKPVIYPQYDGAREFCEDLAAVMIYDQKNNEKWGYIDKTGKLVISARYDSASDFCAGKAQVKIDEKLFTIDKSGEIVDAS